MDTGCKAEGTFCRDGYARKTQHQSVRRLGAKTGGDSTVFTSERSLVFLGKRTCACFVESFHEARGKIT